MKKFLTLLCLGLLLRAGAWPTVLVDTNGVLKYPTNFFTANNISGGTNGGSSTPLPAIAIEVFPNSTFKSNGVLYTVTNSVTAGIQEAINALPVATNIWSPGGGILRAAPGIYSVGQTIHTPTNRTAFTFDLEGSGMNASVFLLTNTTPMPLFSIGQDFDGNAVVFAAHNCMFATLYDAKTNIIELNGAETNYSNVLPLGGVSRADIQFNCFACWNYLTNGNNQYQALSPEVWGLNSNKNLVAINANLNLDDEIVIDHNQFDYIDCISVSADHLSIEQNMFEICAQPSLYATNEAAGAGACVVLREPIPHFGAGGGNVIYNGNKAWHLRGNMFVPSATASWAAWLIDDRFNLPHYIYDDEIERGTLASWVLTTGSQVVEVCPSWKDYSDPSGPSFLTNYFIANTANYQGRSVPTNGLIQVFDPATGLGSFTFNSTNAANKLTGSFTGNFSGQVSSTALSVPITGLGFYDSTGSSPGAGQYMTAVGTSLVWSNLPTGSSLNFTNAAGSKFKLIVNAATNGFTFTPQ